MFQHLSVFSFLFNLYLARNRGIEPTIFGFGIRYSTIILVPYVWHVVKDLHFHLPELEGVLLLKPNQHIFWCPRRELNP